MARATVIGAGVVGLTCAVRLLEQGWRVDVLARDLPLETTSAVSAALWYPYRAEPPDRVLGWASTTYDELTRLAGDGATGVVVREGSELFAEPQEDPWWRSAVPGFRRTAAPEGYADAWTFPSPVAEMPVYLRWLSGRVLELGGTITRLGVSALPEGPDLVVNASGLGSRLLAHDPTTTPVRGQVVLVEQVGLERWTMTEVDGTTYVIPRSQDIVVGGTAEEGDWSRSPVPETAEAILARARALVPALSGARVLRHRVGLRPARPAVRVEREGDVVHCYGHGGAGLTLSWGTADEVAALAAG